MLPVGRFTPDHGLILDARSMRAVAHPVRIRIMRVLRTEGTDHHRPRPQAPSTAWPPATTWASWPNPPDRHQPHRPLWGPSPYMSNSTPGNRRAVTTHRGFEPARKFSQLTLELQQTKG